MEVLTTGYYLNLSSVVYLRSSPLFIPDGLLHLFLMACLFLKVFVSSLRSVPCPFNTIDFGYSTARRLTISACTAIAKDHPFVETPSSFIQHVIELSLLNSYFYFRTHLCLVTNQPGRVPLTFANLSEILYISNHY